MPNGSVWATWKTLSRTSRRLLSVGLGLLLVILAALAGMIWQLRQDALLDARHTVSTLGIAIAEQTARSMQGGDLVLEELRSQIAARRPQTIADFKAQFASEDMHRFLKDRADFLPQIDAYSLIAADGKLVNFSRAWPAPATDLSDRDYIAYFRDHDIPGAFVSAPVQNRGTGAWTAYVVRRVNAPSGEFIGLILAAIDLDYFREFFKALTRSAGTTVTLLRSDGTALTSYPPTARIGDVLPAASPWHRIVKTGPDVFVTQGVLAPGTRIVSVHPLADYPFVINVSVAEWDALAAWARISIAAVIGALLAIALVSLLLWALLRQFRRLEQSETLLASRNRDLETTQRHLHAQARELSASRTVMADQAATLQAALSHMNQGIMLVDADGTVAVCNGRAIAMLDLPPDLLATRPSFGALIAFQRTAGEFAAIPTCPCTFGFEEAMTGPRTHERERPDGRILEIETVPIPAGGLVRTYTDITDRRQSEQQVRFMARHDGLTGLLNRTAFQSQLGGMVAETLGSARQLAVFYVDLDGFKLINDTHGHATGDALLVSVADRLRAVVRDTDLVARMGGDEFAILQPIANASAASVAEFAHDLANRLLGAIAEPFQLGSARCNISLSIGIALYPEHASDVAGLLLDADTALYRAKSGGKRTFCMFDPAIDRGQQSLRHLEQDLAYALPRHELFLEYQPVVDTASLKVVQFEALLRWAHPARGNISPADFIPIAERCGLIVPIGLWVLETACAAAAAWPWQAEISVNLSPLQFARGDLDEHVARILTETGLAPSRLNLEITEGALLENTTLVLQTMSRLRLLGVRFSLDDFGTAHAGLTYLRRFSFDVLKIDKSFVQDAARSDEARGILSAIQAIGIACNLQVVAEGVESEAELDVVRALGCHCVQGYFTGRPSPTVTMANTGEAKPAPPGPRLTLVQP